jgi:hypothetical protein
MVNWGGGGGGGILSSWNKVRSLCILWHNCVLLQLAIAISNTADWVTLLGCIGSAKRGQCSNLPAWCKRPRIDEKFSSTSFICLFVRQKIDTEFFSSQVCFFVRIYIRLPIKENLAGVQKLKYFYIKGGLESWALRWNKCFRTFCAHELVKETCQGKRVLVSVYGASHSPCTNSKLAQLDYTRRNCWGFRGHAMFAARQIYQITR